MINPPMIELEFTGFGVLLAEVLFADSLGKDSFPTAPRVLFEVPHVATRQA